MSPSVGRRSTAGSAGPRRGPPGRAGWPLPRRCWPTALAVIGALVVGAARWPPAALPPVQLAVLVLTPLALHEVLVAPLRGGRPGLARPGRGALDAAAGSDRSCLAAPSVGTPHRRNARRRTRGQNRVRPSGARRGSLPSSLSAGWPGGEPVVDALDLTSGAASGSHWSGRAACGKTTVAATILGLLPPVAGSVRSTGRSAIWPRTRTCSTPPSPRTSGSGGGPRRMRRDRGRAAHGAAGPPLDRLVGLHGDEVSGGEARRIALARLLLRRDHVLILDEPTEHLDAPTAAALLSDLWRLTSGAAVLVITHDPALAAACDRVVQLAAKCGDAASGATDGCFRVQAGVVGIAWRRVCRPRRDPARRGGLHRAGAATLPRERVGGAVPAGELRLSRRRRAGAGRGRDAGDRTLRSAWRHCRAGRDGRLLRLRALSRIAYVVATVLARRP